MTTAHAGGQFGLTRARRTRSFEDIVGQIGTAIIDGRLAVGTRLPNERDLCKIFGVSRSTLREGLRTLEAQGILEIRLGATGGAFVSAPGSEQVERALQAFLEFNAATARDLVEFRLSFEAETAYWAAMRADEGDRAALKALLGVFAETLAASDAPWSALADLDIAFHNLVAKASKNHLSVAIMLGIYRSLRRASLAIQPLASERMRRSILKDLTGIAAAISKPDPEEARRLMRRHVAKFSHLEVRQEEGAEQTRGKGTDGGAVEE